MNTQPPRYIVLYRGNSVDFPYVIKDTYSTVPFIFAAFFNAFDADEYCAFMNLMDERPR